MEIYAVINRKGGVGKTTLAVNLAAGLALRRYPTVLVDLDRGGGASKWFRVKGGDAGSFLYYDREFNECSVRVRPNLNMLGAPTEEARTLGFENRLGTYAARGRLKGVTGRYSVIDCGPGENVFNTNALTIADGLIVPVVPEYLCMRSLDDLLVEIKQLKKSFGDTSVARIMCLVPTAYNARRALHRDHFKALKLMGFPVTRPVRFNTRFAEAAAGGKTIYEHTPEGWGVRDIDAVIDFLLKDLELELE